MTTRTKAPIDPAQHHREEASRLETLITAEKERHNEVIRPLVAEHAKHLHLAIGLAQLVRDDATQKEHQAAIAAKIKEAAAQQVKDLDHQIERVTLERSRHQDANNHAAAAQLIARTNELRKQRRELAAV